MEDHEKRRSRISAGILEWRGPSAEVLFFRDILDSDTMALLRNLSINEILHDDKVVTRERWGEKNDNLVPPSWHMWCSILETAHKLWQLNSLYMHGIQVKYCGSGIEDWVSPQKDLHHENWARMSASPTKLLDSVREMVAQRCFPPLKGGPEKVARNIRNLVVELVVWDFKDYQLKIHYRLLQRPDRDLMHDGPRRRPSYRHQLRVSRKLLLEVGGQEGDGTLETSHREWIEEVSVSREDHGA